MCHVDGLNMNLPILQRRVPALPPTAKRGARKAYPRGLPDEVKRNKLQESGRVARFDEKSIKKGRTRTSKCYCTFYPDNSNYLGQTRSCDHLISEGTAAASAFSLAYLAVSELTENRISMRQFAPYSCIRGLYPCNVLHLPW